MATSSTYLRPSRRATAIIADLVSQDRVDPDLTASDRIGSVQILAWLSAARQAGDSDVVWAVEQLGLDRAIAAYDRMSKREACKTW